MRLPILLNVAQKTDVFNINCSFRKGVKFGSVAWWEHLVSRHGDCRLTSSNMLDMIEKFIYISRKPFDCTVETAMRLRAMRA